MQDIDLVGRACNNYIVIMLARMSRRMPENCRESHVPKAPSSVVPGLKDVRSTYTANYIGGRGSRGTRYLFRRSSGLKTGEMAWYGHTKSYVTPYLSCREKSGLKKAQTGHTKPSLIPSPLLLLYANRGGGVQ